jgi:hypothetical protein
MVGRFTFITSGQGYEVELPEGTLPVPQTRGVFTIGESAHEIIFEPSGRRIHPDVDPQLARLFTAKVAGREVVAYRARQTPPLIAAFWRVKNGFLHTYVDDLIAWPDTCPGSLEDLLKEIVGSISVSDSPNGPFIRTTGPLGPPDLRDEKARDSATFVGDGALAASAGVTLRQEPPWSRAGKAVREEKSISQVTVTTTAGVSAVAVGDPNRIDDLQSAASRAASSLVPLS